MVKQVNGLFQCEKCFLFFKEKERAEKREDWNSKHNSYNLEIVKHGAIL